MLLIAFHHRFLFSIVCFLNLLIAMLFVLHPAHLFRLLCSVVFWQNMNDVCEHVTVCVCVCVRGISVFMLIPVYLYINKFRFFFVSVYVCVRAFQTHVYLYSYFFFLSMFLLMFHTEPTGGSFFFVHADTRNLFHFSIH